MNNLDNIDPETMLKSAVDKIRGLQWLLQKTSTNLAQAAEDLSEFLETHDDWERDREDREEEKCR